MNNVVEDFLAKWHRRNPNFTGEVQLHFKQGALKGIKTIQSHHDVLVPKEQKEHFGRPV